MSNNESGTVFIDQRRVTYTIQNVSSPGRHLNTPSIERQPKVVLQSNQLVKLKAVSNVHHKVTQATTTFSAASQGPSHECRSINFQTADFSGPSNENGANGRTTVQRRITRAMMRITSAKRVELAEISNTEPPKKTRKRKADSVQNSEKKKRK